MPGRRLDFTDVDDFQQQYGDVLDRLGRKRGDFMSVAGATFEERALPPGSLRDPLITLRLTGELPPGWRIEVSEVAPAFGQPGGGLQVRILNADAEAMSVAALRKHGVIDVIGDTLWPAGTR